MQAQQSQAIGRQKTGACGFVCDSSSNHSLNKLKEVTQLYEEVRLRGMFNRCTIEPNGSNFVVKSLQVYKAAPANVVFKHI